MSIIGKCLGVSADQLAAALAESQEVRTFLDEAARRAKRYCRTGEEWHGLNRLVENLGPPAMFAVVGDQPIGSVDVKGYGPARYLSPEVAAVLGEHSPEQMREFYSLEEFREARIYTFDGESETEEEAWDRLRRAYETLKRFYQRVAAAGEAVVCYLH